MAVAGVTSLSRIRFDEADARSVERIDGPDMHAVGADDFHSRPDAFDP
jgi:hypothetical protein